MPMMAKHLDDVDVAVMAGASRMNWRSGRPSRWRAGRRDDADGAAGEGVFGSLTDEDAEIHRALHDDHVSEGEWKEKEDADGGEDDPLRDVLADVGLTDERDDDEDEEWREANAGSGDRGCAGGGAHRRLRCGSLARGRRRSKRWRRNQ